VEANEETKNELDETKKALKSGFGLVLSSLNELQAEKDE